MGVIMHDDVLYGGTKGDRGITPSITATATVDANVGTPSVQVVQSGTDENPNIAFNFSNLKGEQGDIGPDNEGLIRDTVGWTSKNLLLKGSNEFNNRGTITVIDNGLNGITISGTKASGGWGDIKYKCPSFTLKGGVTYVLSCQSIPSNVYGIRLRSRSGSSTTSVFQMSAGQTEATFTPENDVVVDEWWTTLATDAASEFNFTYYPMLRVQGTNNAYVLPHESVEDMLRDAEVIEGKNLLPLTLDILKEINTSGLWSGNAYTWNGITYTITTNEYGFVTEIDVNNTSNALTTLNLKRGVGSDFYEYNDCILSSGNNDDIDTCNIEIIMATSPYSLYSRTTGGEKKCNDVRDIPNDNTSIACRIRIDNGQTLNHRKYKPMIRYASESDPTYKPYYIPLKDSMFPRKEQRVLGAKNFDNPFKTTTQQSAIITKTSTGYTVSMSVSNTYGKGNVWYDNLPKNTDFILSAKGVYTAGVNHITIAGSNDLIPTLTTIVDTESKLSDVDYSLKFNTGNYTYILVTLWGSGGTSVQGSVAYNDYMLRLASDPDDTYVPYAMTNRELTTDKQDKLTFDTTPTANSNNPVTSGGTKSAIDASQNASLQMLSDTVGWTGKNLLPIDMNILKKINISGTWNENSYTRYGVTVTINNDGSVTVNGTATDRLQILLQNQNYHNNIIDDLLGKEVILTGCPSGGSETTYCLDTWWQGGGSNRDTGNGVRFTLFDEYPEIFNIKIDMQSGSVMNNLTFYPMLRYASVTNDTFEPYHKDVDTAKANTSALAPVENGTTASQDIPYGTPFMRNGDWCISRTITSGATLIKDSNYVVDTVGGTFGNYYSLSRYYSKIITSGSDLNDYTDVGSYFCTSSTIAVSLSNCPFNDTGFKLIVESVAGGTGQYRIQTIKRNTSNNAPEIYIRKGYDTTWYNWYLFTGTDFSTPVPAYVANSLPVLKRNITDAFFNGSLRSEIAAGNFAHVRPGDYIKSGNTEIWVAACDGRLGKGDQTNANNYPIYNTHHLQVIIKYLGSTSLWLGKADAGGTWQVSANDKGRCPWNAATDADPTSTSAVGSNNTNITRQYNGASVSGYMGSFIRERMDAVILPYLQEIFGSANVLKYRERNGNAVMTDKPSGGQGNWNGCTSNWAWYDRYLDLPSEVELFGSRIFGSGMDHGTQCEQLPIFKHASIQDIFGRLDIWTKAVAGSSQASARGSDGAAVNGNAGYASWACPLACIK